MIADKLFALIAVVHFVSSFRSGPWAGPGKKEDLFNYFFIFSRLRNQFLSSCGQDNPQMESCHLCFNARFYRWWFYVGHQVSRTYKQNERDNAAILIAWIETDFYRYFLINFKQNLFWFASMTQYETLKEWYFKNTIYNYVNTLVRYVYKKS